MESHLLQMRGLKPVSPLKPTKSNWVASFTDAWIETTVDKRKAFFRVSHLLQMRGLKHCTATPEGREVSSHLLQMRGLKPFATHEQDDSLRRIFYRCVD